MLKLLGWLFGVGFIVFCGLAAGAAYILWQTQQDLPDYKQLAQYEPPVMTRVHAGDGSLLAEYAKQRRLFLPLGAIPQKLIDAFISAEDKGFYQHSGLDWQGVGRAVIVNVQNVINGGGRKLVGASTITQQVAKNFLLTSEQTWKRKLKEALLALRIEQAFSKEQILELYLNEIFLGLNSYGVAAASLNYYGSPLSELTVDEMAYLAALPKGPNNYHPYKQHDKAIERRNWVLSRMADNGYITRAEEEKYQKKPLNVTPRPPAAPLVCRGILCRGGAPRGPAALRRGKALQRRSVDPHHPRPENPDHGAPGPDARPSQIRPQAGYRGPVKRIDAGGDWGEALVEDAVSVRSEPVDACGGSRDDRQRGARSVCGREPSDDGKIGRAAATGIIPLELMKWARTAEADGADRVRDCFARRGPQPRRCDLCRARPRRRANIIWCRCRRSKGALVAMDPHTGRVLALVGGFSYGKSQFNRAVQAMRQPGSSFKPFVYAAALDSGYTPSSVVLDAPVEIKLSDGTIWKPQNYTKKFYGPSTLRRGIELSRNVMTVRLAQDLGMKTGRRACRAARHL